MSARECVPCWTLIEFSEMKYFIQQLRYLCILLVYVWYYHSHLLFPYFTCALTFYVSLCENVMSALCIYWYGIDIEVYIIRTNTNNYRILYATWSIIYPRKKEAIFYSLKLKCNKMNLLFIKGTHTPTFTSTSISKYRCVLCRWRCRGNGKWEMGNQHRILCVERTYAYMRLYT